MRQNIRDAGFGLSPPIDFGVDLKNQFLKKAFILNSNNNFI